MEKNAGWNIVRIIGKYFNQLIYLKYLVKSDDNENGPGEYKPQIMYLDLVSPESGSAIHIKVLFT